MAYYTSNEQQLSTPAEAEIRILNSIQEHVIHYDREMKILWANSAALNSAEISLEKIKKQHCWSIWAQRETPCDNCPVIMAMDTDSVQCIEKTTADGRSWIVKGYPLNDKRGNVIGAIETTLDITNRKKAEEMLRESEGKVNAMLTSLADHMSMIDRDLNIHWANHIAKEMFGENLIGKKCYRAYHGRETPCEPYPCLTLKAFEDERVHTHETQVIGKDGQTKYFHCTANVALRDENGNPTAVLEISRDITDRKLAEKQRDKLITELQKALSEVKTLRGCLPICSLCKKIRDDKGYWNQIEAYIRDHSDAEFSHSICKECAKKLYPELNIYDD